MILFGALFAVFERNDRKHGVLSSAYFWHGLVFTTVFNVAVVYAILFYPDWMWMYFLPDSQNSLSELVYIFVFLYYLPYALGFYLGFDCKKKGIGLWLLWMAFLAGAEVWIVTRLFDRYALVGTNQDFINKTGVSLFSPDNPIGPIMNGALVVMALYLLFVLFLRRRQKRRPLEI